MTKYYAMLVTSHSIEVLLPKYMYQLMISSFEPTLTPYYVLIGEFDKPPKVVCYNANQYLDDLILLPDGSIFCTKQEMYNAFKTTKMFLK